MRRLPTSTYRIQLHAGFTFDDAAAIAPYLAELGVSHLYCSPYLQARGGSTHGYDVVDHGRVNVEIGGVDGLKRLRAALEDAGLGQVLDVVPNHMCVTDPHNAQWWDVLRHGRQSRYSEWFDIDWTQHGERVLLPVLGDSLDEVLGRGELETKCIDDEWVFSYFEHRWPLAAETVAGRDDLAATVERQHYLLADWRQASAECNYRRFFDVTSLAGVRVEVPAVFDATHAVVLDLVRDGTLDGLRIDHPDGLADPHGYLRRLAAAAPEAWAVVEKILEPGESLPDWPVAGTTGYDFLNDVGAVFIDPSGEAPLTALYGQLTGEQSSYAEVVVEAKRDVMQDVLPAEIDTLAALCARALGRVGHDDALVEVLRELITRFPVYRTYLSAAAPADDPGRRVVLEAVATLREEVPTLDAPTVAAVAALLVGDVDGADVAEFVIRFQQTTGAVMAKGVEDTAFYRYHRLVALNEVGGDPGVFGSPVDAFHDRCAAAQHAAPHAMTTLATHDTKRGADVRARIGLLAQLPDEWAETATRWFEHNARHRRDGLPDANTEYLLYQTLVGTWPISAPRLSAYMQKAAREAKRHTSWLRPDERYESVLGRFIRDLLGDESFVSEVGAFVGTLTGAARTASLAQLLVVLTAPGVPDVYQGTELWDHSLVDPDNRRPVDFELRRRLLRELESMTLEQVRARAHEGLPKLLIVSRTLRLRRERPESFGADAAYRPLGATGRHHDRVLAFARADDVVTVVPRLTLGLGGDWADTAVALPEGSWRDALTGARRTGGSTPAAELFADFPVALLVRERG